MQIEFLEVYKPLFEPYRYKVLYSGRGAGKTEAIATYLLICALQDKITILCCREFQTSIKNSVYAVFKMITARHEIDHLFNFTQNCITSITGSEILFAGLHNNIENIKSIPNIKKCWVEEASTVSQDSLDVLLPTIRGDDSEIIFSYNPYLESDPVHAYFIPETPDDCLVINSNWRDNTFFPRVLEKEMLALKKKDYDKYLNVWEGQALALSDAIIFKGKYTVQSFETPKNAEFYHGLDFGYTHSTALIRCYIQDDVLYIDQDAGGPGIDNDKLPALMDEIATAKYYPIYADSADPKGIRFLQLRQYKCIAVKKGPNSVLDGISFLRGFTQIVIHERCKHTIEEFNKYCWKVDKVTGAVIPEPVDAYNHWIDALRYALEKYALSQSTSMKTWAKLGQR